MAFFWAIFLLIGALSAADEDPSAHHSHYFKHTVQLQLDRKVQFSWALETEEAGGRLHLLAEGNLPDNQFISLGFADSAEGAMVPTDSGGRAVLAVAGLFGEDHYGHCQVLEMTSRDAAGVRVVADAAGQTAIEDCTVMKGYQVTVLSFYVNLQKNERAALPVAGLQSAASLRPITAIWSVGATTSAVDGITYHHSQRGAFFMPFYPSPWESVRKALTAQFAAWFMLVCGCCMVVYVVYRESFGNTFDNKRN